MKKESKSESPLIGLSKEEAIEAMRQGKKVTHRYFDSTEWATLVGNRIVFEDGVEMWLGDFLADRQKKEWDTDWFLFTEQKSTSTLIGERSAEEMLRSCSGACYEKWKKKHPNTYQWIIDAMEQYAEARLSNYSQAQSKLINRNRIYSLHDIMDFAIFVGPSTSQSYYKQQFKKWIAARKPNKP